MRGISELEERKEERSSGEEVWVRKEERRKSGGKKEMNRSGGKMRGIQVRMKGERNMSEDERREEYE